MSHFRIFDPRNGSCYLIGSVRGVFRSLFYRFIGLFLLPIFVCATEPTIQKENARSFCIETFELLSKKFQQMDLSQAVGHRGLLANDVRLPLSPEAQMAAFANGINYLGVRIKIVASKAAAFEHDAAIANPLLKSFYVIGDPDLKNLSPEIFSRLSKKGIFWIDEKILKWVSDEDVKNLFQIKKLEVSEFSNDDTSRPPWKGLYLPGWLSPIQQGITDYEDLVSTSLRKRARSLLRDGYTVTFNKAFEQSLKEIAKAKRPSGGASRYDEEYIAQLKSLFDLGLAWSAEVWSPSHQLVSAEVGYRVGNIFKADSVFGEYAKMASLALVDRLHDSGVNFSISGQVTKYSRRMHAKYVSRDEFLSRLESNRQIKTQVDLNAPWIWQEEKNLKKFRRPGDKRVF
ncbi:MAG: putative Leu/Phe-tRNA-protein transferase [Bacteriovoracaceae bacterium]|nr:putative Leu/Phe-tRNA-protein transferase [Bacteriovoracaceae bacterium]